MAIIAVVVAVVIAGSAVAFTVLKDRFSAAGPQAAEAIPSDAVFYVGVDLDPSAEQKINALRFLNHFPAFKEASGVTDADTDIRKTFFDKVLGPTVSRAVATTTTSSRGSAASSRWPACHRPRVRPSRSSSARSR